MKLLPADFPRSLRTLNKFDELRSQSAGRMLSAREYPGAGSTKQNQHLQLWCHAMGFDISLAGCLCVGLDRGRPPPNQQWLSFATPLSPGSRNRWLRCCILATSAPRGSPYCSVVLIVKEADRYNQCRPWIRMPVWTSV
ncbi:hypothetical protein ABW21_db0201515 [Orbilia brochopaga]|nr:hypothetical protein ABW21_db0201515 [Drechslerella brochopaga]